MEKYFENELKELLAGCEKGVKYYREKMLAEGEDLGNTAREFYRGHMNTYNQMVLDLKRILKDKPATPEVKTDANIVGPDQWKNFPSSLT